AFETVEELDKHLAEDAGLGLLTLAAILEGAGVACELFDLGRMFFEMLQYDPDADVAVFAANQIVKREFDVLGVSSICSYYPLTLRFANEVKRRRPDCKVIFGGPQATVTDIATMEAFPAVEMIIRGEADEILLPVLEALSGGGDLERIPGVTYR